MKPEKKTRMLNQNYGNEGMIGFFLVPEVEIKVYNGI